MATFSERLAELNNDPDVLEAVTRSEPARVSGFESIWSATITYASVSGNVARENTIALVGIDHGGQGKAWYWSRGVPDVLTNDPVKYLSGRTAGGWAGLTGAAQASAIEGFCNAVYEAAVARRATL